MQEIRGEIMITKIFARTLRIVLFIVLLLILGLIIITVIFRYPRSPSDMDKELEKYRDEVLVISEYLKSSNYESMLCYRTDFVYNDHPERYGCFNVSGTYEKINDADVLNAVLKLLKKYRFDNIIKENNVLIFVRWATLSQSGGIVYSENTDEIYDAIQFLYVLEPLKEENFYYFETDFERYKSEHEK